jgi:hypothetical protein
MWTKKALQRFERRYAEYVTYRYEQKRAAKSGR